MTASYISSAPSRRTVAKGAAWAVPTVVVGSMVPAMAASGMTACADLVEVDATASVLMGTNYFTIRNVNDRSGGNTCIPAGTIFRLNSSNILNVALGSYAGYNLTLLTINGVQYYIIELQNDLCPGDTGVRVNLGAVQATALTDFTLELAPYSDQPAVTKDALDATEMAVSGDTRCSSNNEATISCLVAVAPLASLCSTS